MSDLHSQIRADLGQRTRPNAPVVLVAGLVFLAAIVVANYLTTHHGLIPVGFGLTATAGTYAAGLTFVVRDTVQDYGGKSLVIALIILGALLSATASGDNANRIALASGVAFLISELADLAVYTPLRSRGYLRAAVASNVVGSAVDTVAFLAIAGFALTGDVFAGQMVAKLAVTVVLVVLVVGARAVLRERV